MDEVEAVERDMAWWDKVAKAIGAILVGWTYRNSATFTIKGTPPFSLSGPIAENILATQEEAFRKGWVACESASHPENTDNDDYDSALVRFKGAQ